MPDSLWDFRVRRLKEMGANAYRCAHNPPAAEFLAACDRLGMLVMDENRNFNTSPEYVRQLQWLVRRDRNHPSVILWSVFNEEPFQGTEQGYQMVRRMAAEVKKLDTTRPVTAAQSGGNLNPVNASQAADVAGFNYQQGQYDKFHAANPTRPMTSSEDTSAFHDPRRIRQRRPTNTSALPTTPRHAGWGATHHAAWRADRRAPLCRGRVRLDGLRLPGRTHPVQVAFCRLVLRLHGHVRLPEGGLLHPPGAMDRHPARSSTSFPHWNWPDKVGQPVKVVATHERRHRGPFPQRPAASARSPWTATTSPPGKSPTRRANWKPWRKRTVAKPPAPSVETNGAPAALQLTPDRSPAGVATAGTHNPSPSRPWTTRGRVSPDRQPARGV